MRTKPVFSEADESIPRTRWPRPIRESASSVPIVCSLSESTAHRTSGLTRKNAPKWTGKRHAADLIAASNHVEPSSDAAGAVA
jgi:hypothetical protein